MREKKTQRGEDERAYENVYKVREVEEIEILILGLDRSIGVSGYHLMRPTNYKGQ
jgi:hypothetical protein